MSPDDNRKVVCLVADAGSVLVSRWVSYAVRRGHRTHVVSLDPPAVPVPGAQYHIVGGRLPARVPRSARMLLAAGAARRAIRSLRPDLVHAHYAWGYGIWAAAAGVHPLVVSAWGSDVMATGARSPAHAKVLRWVFETADKICATGPGLAAATAEFTPKPIAVTPFGVDADLFHPADASPAQRSVIGMVKRLDENSGIEDLLVAMALPSAPSPLRLEVIGQASDNRWHERAADLGISDRVTFLGQREPAEVADRMRGWDLAVQPSKWTEGFGVSVLEAAASGLPVVASRLGGLCDVVDEGITGTLVRPGDPKLLMAAIAELMNDEEGRRAMGRKARERVLGRYDLPTCELVMDEVYAGVGLT